MSGYVEPTDGELQHYEVEPQVEGRPDHAAEVPSLTERLYVRFLSVRKAVVAFVVGGGGAAIAENLRTLDWSSWTVGQIAQGVVVGALSGVVVYFTSNRPAP